MPPGLQNSPQVEADYFKAFFTGAPIQEDGQIFYNNDLTNQAPYTPTRTMYNLTLWQANDPLVHYLASDMSESNSFTGVHRTDDPLNANSPIPTVIQNALGQSGAIIGDDRYQPWGRIMQFGILNNVDKNRFNLSYRDPLVYSPDNWDFPTNAGLPVDWIGRVHRGTPWQTIYLKSTNILAYFNPIIPANGLLTWMDWTGDSDSSDAANEAPVMDWRLASWLTSMFEHQ